MKMQRWLPSNRETVGCMPAQQLMQGSFHAGCNSAQFNSIALAQSHDQFLSGFGPEVAAAAKQDWAGWPRGQKRQKTLALAASTR